MEVVQKLTYASLEQTQELLVHAQPVCGVKNILIARTGYTGEDGFEIYIPSDSKTSEDVWEKVLYAGREFGIRPCGLGRPQHAAPGSEARLCTATRSATSINVWEAGLDRFCRMEKGDFIGRAALEGAKAAGLNRTLVGLEMVDRGIARDGYRCLNEAGEDDRCCYKRLAFTDAGQEHRARVRAAGNGGTWHHDLRRNPRSEGARPASFRLRSTRGPRPNEAQTSIDELRSEHMAYPTSVSLHERR